MKESGLNFEAQIEWHLQSNHYPPVPAWMVKPCIEAIDLCNAGDADELVDLPEGCTFKGSTTAPAYAIVDQHHLGAWIDNLDDY